MADSINNFSKKVLTAVLITVLVISILLLIIYAINIFLLIFTGVLLGIMLRGLANLLKSRTGISINLSLAAVIFGIIFLLTGAGFLMGPSITEGITELSNKIPSAITELENKLNNYEWGKQLVTSTQNAYEKFIKDEELASKITGVFSSTLGLFLYIFVTLVIGLYTALDPSIYVKGIIKIVSHKNRDRAKEVLEALRTALSWWLVGRFSSMFIIGITTSLSLWALGIPLAFTLGVIAAISTFIPNIGPFISAIPAILVGLVESPATALYVIILYVIIQVIESYILTPIIQKRAISLPPALLIIIQILMGVWVGALGILMATPLLVVVIVLVQMLYIEDKLGDNVKIMGTH